MKIGILSYLATYGNAPLLAKGFQELGHDVRMVIRYRNAPSNDDDYGFSDEFPCWRTEKPDELKLAQEWFSSFNAPGLIVLMGIPSLLKLAPRVFGCSSMEIRSRPGIPGAIVLSSSHLMRGLPAYRRRARMISRAPVDFNNESIRTSGFKPFVQPHKRAYCTIPDVTTYYPPITDVDDTLMKPDGPIRIGHSPGKITRRHWKGTDLIESVFMGLSDTLGDKVDCQVAPRMSHADVLEWRRSFHIFVDQICPPHRVIGYPDYEGGLDKAGLEAMAAGCAVITSGGPFDPPVGHEPPPVIRSDAAGLYQVLEDLIRNRKATKQIGQAGREWVRKACKPTVVAERILKAIG